MRTSGVRNIVLFFSTLLINLPLLSGTWGDPTNLSAGGEDGLLPSLGLTDTFGAAVWQDYEDGSYLIQGATLLIGGVWTAPFNIADTLTNEAYPKVGIYAAGDAVAVWQDQDGSGNSRIWSSQQIEGLEWTTPVALSAAGEDALYPKIGISSAGTAIAAWYRYNSGGYPVVQVATSVLGGLWSAVTTLSGSTSHAFDVALAVNSDSNAIVAWSSYDGSNFTIQAARRVSGSWTAAVTVSAGGGDAILPRVAIDTSNNIFVVWSLYDSSDLAVQASRFSSGSWSAPVTLSAAGQHAFLPSVAVSETGNGVAVWSRSDGSHYIIQASSYTAGSWSAPVDISSSGASAAAPQVVMDSSSNAVAIWARSDGSNVRVQGANRPSGGAWTAPTTISTAGEDAIEPSLVTNTSGDALAIWSFFQNGFYRVKSATYTP